MKVGTIDRIVGARIRVRREGMGLTPEALAARLGCAPALLADYESGRVRAGAATLIALAGLCGVNPGYFLWGLGETSTSPERPRQSSLS